MFDDNCPFFYEVTDNRISIKNYFFDMDTNNNIHIYKNMRWIETVELGIPLTYNQFINYCNELYKELLIYKN